MNDLTPRQREILDLIQASLEQTGLPPTRAEIGKAFGFKSPNAAEGHLRALARKGAIELIPGSSRGIRVLWESNAVEGMPVVGRVAAGNPILAQEYIEDYYDVDPRLFNPGADYLLRVHGMSMRDAGILDGDLLAVHKTPKAEDGQIVVARIGNEVTVKRLQHAGEIIQLLPENPDFQPINVTENDEEISIEGIAVGIIRSGGPL
ncbi:MAG: transcriptional repressor LexA [bacterium]